MLSEKNNLDEIYKEVYEKNSKPNYNTGDDDDGFSDELPSDINNKQAF